MPGKKVKIESHAIIVCGFFFSRKIIPTSKNKLTTPNIPNAVKTQNAQCNVFPPFHSSTKATFSNEKFCFAFRQSAREMRALLS